MSTSCPSSLSQALRRYVTSGGCSPTLASLAPTHFRFVPSGAIRPIYTKPNTAGYGESEERTSSSSKEARKAQASPSPLPALKSVREVRRNDLNAVLQTTQMRLLNWTMEYYAKSPEIRANMICDVIHSEKPDAAVLHDVSPRTDNPEEKSTYRVLQERLVETGEYDCLVEPSLLDEHPYGFIVVIVRKDSVAEHSMEWLMVDDASKDCYHVNANVMLNTQAGPVPVNVFTTRWGEYGFSAPRQRALFEWAHAHLAGKPHPSLYAVMGVKGKPPSIRYLHEERRLPSNDGKFSDAFVKAGSPEEHMFNYDRLLIREENIGYPVRMRKNVVLRSRPLRVFLQPASGREEMRPLVRDFRLVGKDRNETIDNTAASLFGVLVDLLVPVTKHAS